MKKYSQKFYNNKSNINDIIFYESEKCGKKLMV